jgi:hypothetical protein
MRFGRFYRWVSWVSYIELVILLDCDAVLIHFASAMFDGSRVVKLAWHSIGVVGCIALTYGVASGYSSLSGMLQWNLLGSSPGKVVV